MNLPLISKQTRQMEMGGTCVRMSLHKKTCVINSRQHTHTKKYNNYKLWHWARIGQQFSLRRAPKSSDNYPWTILARPIWQVSMGVAREGVAVSWQFPCCETCTGQKASSEHNINVQLTQKTLSAKLDDSSKIDKRQTTNDKLWTCFWVTFGRSFAKSRCRGKRSRAAHYKSAICAIRQKTDAGWCLFYDLGWARRTTCRTLKPYNI